MTEPKGLDLAITWCESLVGLPAYLCCAFLMIFQFLYNVGEGAGLFNIMCLCDSRIKSKIPYKDRLLHKITLC